MYFIMKIKNYKKYKLPLCGKAYINNVIQDFSRFLTSIAFSGFIYCPLTLSSISATQEL